MRCDQGTKEAELSGGFEPDLVSQCRDGRIMYNIDMYRMRYDKNMTGPDLLFAETGLCKPLLG